jgi:hypothetical protein
MIVTTNPAFGEWPGVFVTIRRRSFIVSVAAHSSTCPRRDGRPFRLSQHGSFDVLNRYGDGGHSLAA